MAVVGHSARSTRVAGATPARVAGHGAPSASPRRRSSRASETRWWSWLPGVRMHALYVAIGEREKRPRRVDGLGLHRGEHELEQVAVDDQLVRPCELGLDPLERVRAREEVVAGPEVQVGDDSKPAHAHSLFASPPAAPITSPAACCPTDRAGANPEPPTTAPTYRAHMARDMQGELTAEVPARSEPEAAAAARSERTMLLVVLAAAAGIIHAKAFIDHAPHYWLYGAFFGVLAYAQVLWAFVRRSPARRSALAHAGRASSAWRWSACGS